VEVGGQRPWPPESRRKKRRRQSGLRSPPVACRPAGRESPDMRQVKPKRPDRGSNSARNGANPRNGLGIAKPTAVQSGNRSATPLGACSRRKQPRIIACANRQPPCCFALRGSRRARAGSRLPQYRSETRSSERNRKAATHLKAAKVVSRMRNVPVHGGSRRPATRPPETNRRI